MHAETILLPAKTATKLLAVVSAVLFWPPRGRRLGEPWVGKVAMSGS
jgi:hypothetical protein